MTSSDYKSSKEAFVSGMTGSSITHVNAVSAVALSSIALYAALRSRLPASKPLNLPTEWLLLVLPLLLAQTLFAHRPALLSLLLLAPTAVLLLLVPARTLGSPLLSRSELPPRPPSPSHAIDMAPAPPAPGAPRPLVSAPLPALTTYRAHMLIMTALSILAVDFPVFPRALAKCETFGVSLMDIGVGSFVFSQGIISAIPLLRHPAYLSAPLLPKVATTVRKMLPVIALGLVRVILVKGTQYPEHESEYGTHWNFFFTLALVPVMEIFLHPLIAHLPISLIGCLIALSHQFTLSATSLQRFALTAPRTNIISANKEGLISLTGYLAIHLLGLSTGTVLLPPSPSDFRRQQQLKRRDSNATDYDAAAHAQSAPYARRKPSTAERQDGKTAIELCSYAVVWWAFLGLASFLGVGSGVSRRLANLPYVLWVSAFNTSFLLGYLLLDMFFFPAPTAIKSAYSSARLRPEDAGADAATATRPVRTAPVLLEAVNRNGLVLFLVANLATGVVNLSVSTMYATDWMAMIILSAYSFGVCCVAWLTKGSRIW